jgi:hypothetical protein
MSPSAIIQSQHADPTRCAIDLAGYPLGRTDYGCDFWNIEFRNGGAVTGYHYASAMFVGCHFKDPIRVASMQEGRLYLTGCEIVGGNSGTYGLGSAEAVDLARCRVSDHQGACLFTGFVFDANGCIFERNVCTGGLLEAVPWMDMTPSLDAYRCQFQDNAAPEGMLLSSTGYLTAVECTFARNVGPSVKVTVWEDDYGIPVRVSGCTMSDNQGASEVELVREYGTGTTITLLLDHSVLAFRDGGYPVACTGEGIVTEAVCCDIFGNEGGDWVGCIAQHYGVDGNVSLDPLFCGGSDGYRLQEGSPCAPGGTCTDLIGAWPVGCPSDVPPTPDNAGVPLLVLHPNPSIGRVCFQGSAGAGALTIDLFDAAGRWVRALNGDGGARGLWVWDGRGAHGSPVPTGAYLYRARSATREQRGSVVLTR